MPLVNCSALQSRVSLKVFLGKMQTPGQLATELRPSVVEDEKELAPIMQKAFRTFNLSVGLPPHLDYETVELAAQVLHEILQSSSYGITALDRASGRPVGAAFLNFPGESLQSIGPVFVDPEYSNKGVGKALMVALIDKAKTTNAKSIHLVQIAANTKSFSLYAKLGFRPVECISYFEGSMRANLQTLELGREGFKVRHMEDMDVHPCSELHKSVLGYERETDILAKLHMNPANAWVAVKDGILQAYTTGFCIDGHSVAVSEEALLTLIQDICHQKCEYFMNIHIPGRIYPFLIDWALKNGLRLMRHGWIMVIGEYQSPLQGCIWLPSIDG